MSLPLYTDPAIEYLSSLATSDWAVFEYGGGGSTEWFRKNCKQVITVEHNSDWHSRVGIDTAYNKCKLIFAEEMIPESAKELDKKYFDLNVTIPMRTDKDLGWHQYHGLRDIEYRAYAGYVCEWPNKTFDCIVVDGMARSLCLWYAMNLIKDNGVIILDNSDRWNLNYMQEYLISHGYNRLDFWQPYHPCWCTSFFSRQHPVDASSQPRPENTGDIYIFG